jgi:hypothetical protein
VSGGAIDAIPAISEAASEKRRGRPRTYDKNGMAALKTIWNDVQTDRHLQNKRWELKGQKVLWPDDHARFDVNEFTWIVDWNRFRATNKVNSGKWGIVSEIGRLADAQGDDAARDAARAVCEFKLATKAAVAVLRRVRLGRAAPARRLSLLERLARVLNQYRAEHPDTSADDLRAVCAMLIDLVDSPHDDAAA